MKLKLIVIFLIIIAGVNCSKEIDKEKFEGVYRSARSLSAATKVGVNRFQFTQLLTAFATEYSMVKNKGETKKEKDLIANYQFLLSIYYLSSELWDLKFERQEWVGEITIPTDKFKDLEESLKLVRIPYVTRTNYYGGKTIQIGEDSIQYIWTFADLLLEKIDAPLNKN
jgi:hypothetical protein